MDKLRVKNVNILTIHKEPNYGAVLQAYALYKTIENLGYTPHIINLSMDYRRFPYSLKYRVLLGLHKWIKGYSHCFAQAEQFSKLHCPNQIGNFHTTAELESYPWNEDDYYLIGSDQVWNPEITQNLRTAFCFSFLKKDAKNRYAYAASFGNIKDEERRKSELDMKALSLFKRIAVREKFGVEFLHRNGLEATEVIDPTLLLDSYKNLLPRKVEEKNEILFLSLSDTADMNSFVEELSAKTGLPVRKHYGYLQPERIRNMEFLSVEEWLYAIASAKTIVTDSFHATVFSILFGKPFYVYISEPSKVFRISNLLDILGIEQRIVNDVDDAVAAPSMNYEAINKRLSAYRESSLNYLKSIFA